MTQGEIEAERLREQILQLQHQQESQQKHWGQLVVILACTAVAQATVSTIIAVIAGTSPTPPIPAMLNFTSLLLIVLCLAFGARRAAGISDIGSGGFGRPDETPLRALVFDFAKWHFDYPWLGDVAVQGRWHTPSLPTSRPLPTEEETNH